jgi:hypothetical protein
MIVASRAIETRLTPPVDRTKRGACGLAILIYCLLNVAAWHWLGPASELLNIASMSESNYTSPMYGTWTWWMVRGFLRQSMPPDVVLLGSSQVNAPSWAADAHLTKKPVDCLEHREVTAFEQSLSSALGNAQLKVFNCAVQGGIVSDYYIIERALFQERRTPRLVVLCVSPRDFMDNKVPSLNSTEPFRFFSRFADVGSLSNVAYPDLGSRSFALLEQLISRLPLRNLNDCLVGLTRLVVGSERDAVRPNGGQTLTRALYTANQQVKLGQFVVPVDMKDTFVDNTQEYVRRYANPRPVGLGVQLAVLKETLLDLKAKGCGVLLIEMPTMLSNRSLLPASFWREYRKSLADICRDTATVEVDISESNEFQQGDYVDTVHLNDRGGLKFFATLARIVAANEVLAKRLLSGRSIQPLDGSAQ